MHTHTHKKNPLEYRIGQVWAINHDVSIEQCLLSPCPARLFFSSQTKLQPAIVILLTVGSCQWFGFILLKHMLQAVRPPLRKIVMWRSLPFPFLVQVNINFINLYKYMAGKAVYMLDSNIILYFFRWPTTLNPFAFKNNLPFISGMVISNLILWELFQDGYFTVKYKIDAPKNVKKRYIFQSIIFGICKYLC